MHYGSVPKVFRIFSVSTTVLFAMQMNAAFAATATPGVSDFEIPISELNKVKKKTPVKPATSGSRKKRKSHAKTQEPSKAAAPDVPAVPAVQAENSSAGSITASASEPTLGKSPAADKPSSNVEDTMIHHFPHSFVVAAKPTEIHTVIDSKADIMDVNCSIRSNEDGGKTLVKMEKVNGTHFTYKAILPAVPPGSGHLRYTINVVDSQGINTRSAEFATPVTASPVVPSWQVASATEVIPAAQQGGEKKSEGASAQISSR